MKPSGEIKHLLMLSVLGMLIVLPSSTAHAEGPQDILIIANNSIPLKSISVGELRNIFLKKRTKWNGGLNAVPIHHPRSAKLRQEFNRIVLKMSLQEEKKYWENQKIKKGITPPPAFGKPLRAVFGLKGSVGYIYRSDYLEGVSKIILVIPSDKQLEKK